MYGGVQQRVALSLQEVGQLKEKNSESVNDSEEPAIHHLCSPE